VACLASFLCQPYEEVLRVAAQQVRDIREGLFAKDHIEIAKAFDVKLKRRLRRIDLEEHEGILGLQNVGDESNGHSVVLASGLIFDPEERGVVWDAETFTKHFKKVRVYDLLEEE
jgi:hypothetical protein